MRTTARSVVVLGVIGWLGACGEPEPGDASTSGDATTAGAEGSTTAGPSETSSGADGSSGDPVDGYPAEVLERLDLPWPPFEYDPPLPDHFTVPAVQALDNTPAGNPISDDGATLGRVLFYDVVLSANETISCASCHPQQTAFADPLERSEGFEGGLTRRNSMGLSNARFYAPGHFFWDERAATLEDQVLMPIQDPVEMGLTLAELVERVGAQPYYPVLFERAFGDAAVDADRISRALAQFVRSITSHRSPYDEGLSQTGGDPLADFPSFTAQQNLGKAVFFGVGNCATCHLGQLGEPLPAGMPPAQPPGNAAVFMLIEPLDNGIDAPLVGVDNGVGDQLGDTAFNGMFKSPSLRNADLTAPYMHDGRFETLAHVVQHYDTGVQPHPNLDPRLEDTDGQPQRLNLQTVEKQALLSFLSTLTDVALVEDVRFSDPFLP